MANDGTVKIGTELDDSGLKKGLGKLGGMAGAGLKTLTTAVTGTAVAMAGLGAAAIKVGSDFEAQMSRVQAISGATGADFEKLREQAKQLGADTAFSAQEAAEGMENLASAGFATEEIMAAMPGMLNLAASAGESLATSSDIAASTLRAFGMEAAEAGHVADVLAKNAADTNAAVADTGEAMKYVAPVAASMGFEFEECAAAIGILADNGIKGSQAGTTLRGAMTRLAKPTKAMKETMMELDLSFYDAEGKMLSLAEQSAMLKEATAGLTNEQRDNALATIYGQEALSGMLALINSEEGRLEDLTDAYKDCDGAAADMAETMQDNLKSQIEQIGGSLESLGISIYDSLAEPLTNLAKEANGMIDELNDAFNEDGFSGLAAAGGNIVAQMVTGMAQSAPTVINGAVAVIKSFLAGIQQNLPAIVQGAIQTIGALAQGIISMLPTILQMGFDIVMQLAQGLLTNLPMMMQTGFQLIADLLNGITAQLPAVIQMAVDLIIQFATSFIDNLPTIVEAGLNLIVSLIEGIVEALPQLMEQAPTIIAKLVEALIKCVPKLLEAALRIMIALGKYMVQSVSNLIAYIPQIIVKIKEAFTNTDWGEVGHNIIDGIKNGVVNKAKDLVNAVVEAAKNAVDGVKGFLDIHSPSRLLRDLIGKNMIAGISVGVVDETPNLVKTAKKAMGNVVGEIKSSVAAFSATRGSSTDNNSQGDMQTVGGGGVTNTYNFYQPVETPDETARAIRKANTFGLAGA